LTSTGPGVEHDVMTEPGYEGYHDPLALMLLRHAADRPGALCAKDDVEALTYAQLYDQVAATAAGLWSLGVRPGDRVAVRLPNSVGFLSVALGCLWLGAPFVPISIDDPASRVEQILNDNDPALVVDLGRDDATELAGRRVISPDVLARSRGVAPDRAQDPDRDAYMIYTSGTTGLPKGVRIPLASFGWSISATAQGLGLDASTRSLCVSPFHFDGSYATLFASLVAGGCVVIPKREQLLFVRRFFRAVHQEGITHTSFSPSYLRLVLASPKLGDLAGSALRTMGLGGEQIEIQDLVTMWDILPDLRIYNYYGPTEATIEVTTYELDRSTIGSGPVPIGMPHPGVRFYLLDADRRVIEDSNEIGELHIAGNQLMAGYWGAASVSDAVLRSDVVPGELVYKTGDLARRDEHGRYVYVGRADDVVKRRGVRISLIELSRVLREVEGVSAVACVLIEIEGRLGIAAFVQTEPGVTVSALLELAGAQLASTMLPDRVFVVEEFPMTTAGKVDRRALLASVGLRKWGDRWGATGPDELEHAAFEAVPSEARGS
jgi:D-alanine--poly(phosphoribitol) ligase subunit 1